MLVLADLESVRSADPAIARPAGRVRGALLHDPVAEELADRAADLADGLLMEMAADDHVLPGQIEAAAVHGARACSARRRRPYSRAASMRRGRAGAQTSTRPAPHVFLRTPSAYAISPSDA